MRKPPRPQTAGEWLSWARQYIALVDARLLLRQVLCCTAVSLAAHPEQVLAKVQRRAFVRLVARRRRGEPVAYLLGQREFYGRVFQVTPAVLIPRPETELLVDLALQHYGAATAGRVLDLGTGSGVLAVSLAKELPWVMVVAVDRSAAALKVARINADSIQAKASFVQADWFSAFCAVRFRLIVANPPYVASADPHLECGDVHFEPREALVSGQQGLEDLRRISQSGGRFLEHGGWLLMEHGYDQAADVRHLLAAAGFSQVASWRDLAGIERVSGGQWCKTGN